MSDKNKNVDALKEQLPQIRTEADKAALSECGDAINSNDPEKLNALPEKFKLLSPELQEQVLNATKLNHSALEVQRFEKTKNEILTPI
ncbi:MAG: hypothetical protein HY840_14075 [Bacteroidetes bacterium]|nr:hypothetical protein [Bacteroidota bacterium]